MSDNWVVQHLINTLDTWNEKLAEVWQLLTMSPSAFKGGGIWRVILNINGSLQAIGLALLVLFFLSGVVKTSANLGEIKRPEHALKLFIRCHCQGCSHIWSEPNDGDIQYNSGDHNQDHEYFGYNRSIEDNSSKRDGYCHRGLRIL